MARRPAAEAEGAGAEAAAGTGDRSVEGFLEAGGVTGGEEATGGQGGEGTGASRRGSGDGEVAAATATARRDFTAPSSHRVVNPRKQFRTPQAIRSDTHVANSQFQRNEFAMEGETESTASSPQPPLPGGIGRSSLPLIPRTEPEMRFAKPAGARNGASDRVLPVSGEHRPARNTSAKTSPVKINKPVRIKRRCSRTTSDVWEYFTQEDTEDGSIAICMFCDQVYQCDRSFHGTSTLRSHLLYRCPSCPFTDHEKRRKLQDDQRVTVEDCRRALAKMIIMDEYPFSAVEGEGFREYSRTLQPHFDPPSRYTVARDCLNLYLEEKAKLKEVLRHQRVCLTTDTWTSIQNQNYMSLTGHWINNRWQLERKVLNFCFVTDHTGDTLGRKIEECLLEWDIGNFFILTVDNATSNNSAIQYLKTATKDWDSTISDNEFLHVRCCAHIVNLVVKKGWEVSNASVARIRTAVLYAKSSPGRLGQFKRCVQKEKIPEKSLFSLDVDTRWNSTYLMLEATVPFEKAFKRLGDENKYYASCFSKVGGPPTPDDWLEARKLISVFKLFYNVTVRFSGQLYVTSTTFFHDFLLMHNKIAQLIRGKEQEASLGSMAENMKQKFDKYWDNHDGLNPLLIIAIALDPRYKVKYLEYCFSNIYDKEKARSFTKKVEDGLARLFVWYAEADSAASRSEPPHAPLVVDLEECADDPRRLWASNFKEHLQVIESKAANTELSRYLLELCEKDRDEFDILTWWRDNRSKYPTLSKVAKDVLAVPVSTVASESSFSTGGRVISPQRSSLSPKMVEALICGQSWFRSSHKRIDIRQAIEDSHKYEELARELGAFECGET